MTNAFPMLRTLLLTLLIITSASLMGQGNPYPWRLRLDLGASSYFGDLSYQWSQDWQHYAHLPNESQPYAVGLGLERRLNSTFGVSLNGQYAALMGTDRLQDWNGSLLTENPNFARSLNFRTRLYAANLMATVYLDNGWLLRKNSWISPYLLLGAGYANFSVSGDLLDENGERYNYQSAPELDQRFETDLTNLQTEENGDYAPFAWQVPLGAGVDFRLSERLRLGLRYQYVYTFTDYLDDVSGFYRTDFSGETNQLAAYASNPAELAISSNTLRGDGGDTWKEKDAFGLLSLSLGIELGSRKNAFRPPIFYAGAQNDLPSGSPEAVSQEVSSDDSVSPIIVQRVPVSVSDSLMLGSWLDSFLVNAPLIQPTSVPEKAAQEEAPTATDAGAELSQTEEKQVEEKAGEQQVTANDSPEATATPDTVIAPSRPDTVVMVQNTTTSSRDTIVVQSREVKNYDAAEMAALTVEMQQIRADQERQYQRLQEQLLAMQTSIEQGKIEAEQREADRLEGQIEALRRELQQEKEREVRSVVPVPLPAGEAPADTALQAELTEMKEQMTRIESQLAAIRLQNTLPLEVDSLAAPAPDSVSRAMVDSAQAQPVGQKPDLDFEFEYVDSPESREPQTPVRTLTIEKRDTIRLRDTLVLRDTVQMSSSPDTVVREIEGGRKVVALPKASIFFAKGSTELFPADIATLDSIAADLLRNEELAVRLSGFADKSGNAEINQRISRQRAERVSQYLQAKGITEDRIEIQYFGDERTRYNEGALDRRVEIEVYLK